MISFIQDQNYFLIEGKDFSYALGISPKGDLHHLHWGAPLDPHSLMTLLTEWRTRTSEPTVILENQRREFPDFGHNDLRNPVFHLEQADGSRISHFIYSSHEILPGKPVFEGPCSYVEDPSEAETLKIVLRDDLKHLDLILYYTLYSQWGILVKRTVLQNNGSEAIHALKLMSTGIDLPGGDYQLVSFAGAWAHERRLQKQALLQGMVRLESRRGISSHEMNPFVMVTRGKADEEKGEVYGLALAYSGNWVMEAEIRRNGWLRLGMGLNDFDFKWRLEPGKSFFTPECVMAYSNKGFGALSQNYHPFVRKRLTRGEWRDKPRPILINNWEATYFNFKHDDILRIAKTAGKMGVEMMVLDDGWFGERDKDDSSLGDWFEDKKKLPQGMKGLAEDIHDLGIKFGLWIEPEMVSPKSQLYEQHPDWCLHVPGRDRLTFRTQLVLDMSRKEVRDYLFETIGKVLEEAKVDYVKWDMNRALTEVGNEILPPDRQTELYHRYMFGVYELMDRFNKRFPHILFEGCAGGGARFDLGILNYHPQIWTSDNSDGLDRLFIQYGTSFCYPPITQGAHIAASPNHITKRETPLKWRALMAMSGNFGLELDVTKWTAKEKKEVAGYIARYKEIRPLVQFGNFYRLESPYDSDRASWMFVNEAQTEALLFVFQVKPFKKGVKAKPIRLRGLNPAKKYEIHGEKTKLIGKKLMKEGWLPKDFKNPKGSYYCELYQLKTKT
jgi:alpha-galactosidase